MSDTLTSFAVLALAVLGGGWLFWPRRGQFWRWRRARKKTRRIIIEDALKHIHDCEYHNRIPTAQSLAGVLRLSVNEVTGLMADMQTLNLLTFSGDRPGLTPRGRDYALRIIRAHRLWERYLADKTGVPESEWHSHSERREHRLTPAQTDALATKLGHPRFDPHGDPIPTAKGELAAREGCPLPNFPLDKPGRIIHLEDEPETVYAQLVAEGLHPGITIRLTQVTPQRVRFWASGDEHILAPIVAANISVAPALPEEALEPEPFEPLSSLKPGQTGRVVGISRASRSPERRRMMDLGILPGTVIKAEMVSPGGDPTAYRIRGALIGLRREQASLIHITTNTPQPTGKSHEHN
ncbi:MAG: DtxR family transcriptional regulator [Anaerolineae bacterium]